MASQKVSKINYNSSKNFFLYISPWIFGFIMFTIVPMLFSLYMSFTNSTILGIGTEQTNFIWFENYKMIFTKDNVFIKSIFNTFTYALLRVAAVIIFSLLLAMLLNTKMHGNRIFRTLIYLPAIIPIVSSALLWQLLLNSDMSIFNSALSAIGLPKIQFLSYDNALYSVLLMSVWSGLGPTMIIFLAALQGVPEELLEAAKLDGAGACSKFYNIILPIISSSIIFIAITGMIGALQAYAEMDLLTGGGPGDSTITMTMQVVGNAFSSDAKGIGYASAQSWFIFAIIMVFTAVFMKINSKYVYYGESSNEKTK